MMNALPILIQPHPLLHAQSRDVLEGMQPDRFIDAMRSTVRHHKALGLAAIQVGIPLRIMCLNVEATRFPFYALMNPQIVWSSEETAEQREYCLSSPGQARMVTRPTSIKLTFLDRQFREHGMEAKGLAARVIQHEMDHFDGRTLGMMGMVQ